MVADEDEVAGDAPGRCGRASLQGGGPVAGQSDALAGPRQVSGMPRARHPVDLPEGYHTPSRGQSCTSRLPVASRAAPGPSRGRAAPGRRDATRARVRFGGANPERTTWERPTRAETYEQEDAGQPARDRHQPSALGSPHPRSGRRGRRFKSCHPDQQTAWAES